MSGIFGIYFTKLGDKGVSGSLNNSVFSSNRGNAIIMAASNGAQSGIYAYTYSIGKSKMTAIAENTNRQITLYEHWNGDIPSIAIRFPIVWSNVLIISDNVVSQSLITDVTGYTMVPF